MDFERHDGTSQYDSAIPLPRLSLLNPLVTPEETGIYDRSDWLHAPNTLTERFVVAHLPEDRLLWRIHKTFGDPWVAPTGMQEPHIITSEDPTATLLLAGLVNDRKSAVALRHAAKKLTGRDTDSLESIIAEWYGNFEDHAKTKKHLITVWETMDKHNHPATILALCVFDEVPNDTFKSLKKLYAMTRDEALRRTFSGENEDGRGTAMTVLMSKQIVFARIPSRIKGGMAVTAVLLQSESDTVADIDPDNLLARSDDA